MRYEQTQCRGQTFEALAQNPLPGSAKIPRSSRKEAACKLYVWSKPVASTLLAFVCGSPRPFNVAGLIPSCREQCLNATQCVQTFRSPAAGRVDSPCTLSMSGALDRSGGKYTEWAHHAWDVEVNDEVLMLLGILQYNAKKISTCFTISEPANGGKGLFRKRLQSLHCTSQRANPHENRRNALWSLYVNQHQINITKEIK